MQKRFTAELNCIIEVAITVCLAATGNSLHYYSVWQTDSDF